MVGKSIATNNCNCVNLHSEMTMTWRENDDKETLTLIEIRKKGKQRID